MKASGLSARRRKNGNASSNLFISANHPSRLEILRGSARPEKDTPPPKREERSLSTFGEPGRLQPDPPPCRRGYEAQGLRAARRAEYRRQAGGYRVVGTGKCAVC